MKTRQQLFDMAFTGLLRQDFQRAATQGSSGASVCVYRAKHGLKCAIGHMIPDDRYDPRMDVGSQEPGTGSGFTKACVAADIGDSDWPWARGLQQCHDTARNASEMLRSLIHFALRHNLKAPMDLSSRWLPEAQHIYRDIMTRGIWATPGETSRDYPGNIHKGYPHQLPSMYMSMAEASDYA